MLAVLSEHDHLPFDGRRLARAGARIVFDDYDHPDYPGIREAIEALGLTGHARGTVFVHEVPRGDGG